MKRSSSDENILWQREQFSSCRKVYSKCPCSFLSQQKAPTANAACAAPAAVAVSTCAVPRERDPPPSGTESLKVLGKQICLCVLLNSVSWSSLWQKQGGWKDCFYNPHERKEKWSGLHCLILRQFKEIRQFLDTTGLQRRFSIIHWKVEVKILIIPTLETVATTIHWIYSHQSCFILVLWTGMKFTFVKFDSMWESHFKNRSEISGHLTTRL